MGETSKTQFQTVYLAAPGEGAKEQDQALDLQAGVYRGELRYHKRDQEIEGPQERSRHHTSEAELAILR